MSSWFKVTVQRCRVPDEDAREVMEGYPLIAKGTALPNEQRKAELSCLRAAGSLRALHARIADVAHVGLLERFGRVSIPI